MIGVELLEHHLPELALADFSLSELLLDRGLSVRTLLARMLSGVTSNCEVLLSFFWLPGQARAAPASDANAAAGSQKCENRGVINLPSAARGWSVLCKFPSQCEWISRSAHAITKHLQD